MTVTFPPSGSPVPRRPRTRRLLATLAAAAITLGLALPTAATAATTTPSPSPSPTGTASSLALTPSANGILRPGESLSVTVSRSNAGSAALGATTAALAIGTAPLADRAALGRWLSGDTSGVTLQTVGATPPLDATSPGAQTSATISAPGTDPALAGRGAGVYPLLSRADDLSATSVVVVPADGTPTAPLALIVPITAGPLTRGLLTAGQLASLTAVDGPLTAQLDAVDGTGATLAIDPAIPAAIRVLGTSAPPTALAWLQRLLGLPNERFALQFGDADLASQVQAGITTPLAPTSLQTYMTASDFTSPAPAVSTGPTPSPASTPGQPVYPDLSSLLDIGAAVPNVYWPATGTAGGGVVAALGSLGGADAPARVVVASRNLTAGSPRTAAARVGSVSTPVYDDDASRALTDAAGQNDATRRGASLAAAQGYLAFARADASGAPVLVALDRGAGRSRASLRAAVSLTVAAPGFDGRTLTGLVSTEASDVSIAEPTPDQARADDVTALTADEPAIDAFATILAQPELLTGRERAEMLQVLNVAWTGDDARTAVTEHRDATQKTLDSVGILSSDFRLVSSSAPLRPWVRNDLPWPVSVELSARPNDPRLRVQDRTPVDAQASANTRTEIPVEARIANGEVRVSLQLFSPTGEPIGAPQSVSVEVRAEWENIGLVVIIGLVVVFLGVGVTRTVARRRRLRRSESAPDATDPGIGSKDADADGRGSATADDEDEPFDTPEEIRP